MKRKYKVYLSLNLVSIFFIAASFTFATFAWFAYSGLAKVDTEVDVKAWYIKIENKGEAVVNKLVVPLSVIYPGMESTKEIIRIKNLGDSDASLNYSITSARILDNPNDSYFVDENITSEYVEDVLSHNYPFHINVSLNKHYLLTQEEDGILEVSISWPLDSGNDSIDSKWGLDAYNFKQIDERPSIQLTLNVSAEQYVASDEASDIRYNLGDNILYDTSTNTRCTEIGGSCLNTYVIDKNNTIGDEYVTLLPNLYNTYTSGSYSNYITKYNELIQNWNATTKANTRLLEAKDLLKIISNDIENSSLISNNISSAIIGNLNYPNKVIMNNIEYQDRITAEIARAINNSGYYSFINSKFPYFLTTNCYWINTNYNLGNAFAIKKIDENYSKIYPEDKTQTCNIVPIIRVLKEDLENV